MMATRDRVIFDLALPLLGFVVIAVLSWLVPVRAYAQTTTAPPRYSFPPIIESVTPSTGVTASGARVSARVPGLEPEMLDYYQSKMNPTPTPDGGVKYGAQRTARVRVSPTDVIDVPFKETLKADKALIGKAVAKFAKVLPIVGNVVALAELADFGLDYANGGFSYREPTVVTPISQSVPNCQKALDFGMTDGSSRYFQSSTGLVYHAILLYPPASAPAGYTSQGGCVAFPTVNYQFPALYVKNVTGNIPQNPSAPATDSQVEMAVGKAIDRDVSAAIRMAELAGRKVLEEMSFSTPVEFEAAPQSTPSRQESVTQTDKPDGSVDTSTTTVQTTVTPSVSGSTIGNSSMTLNSNSTYTTSTTNNVTNNTSVTQTTVNNNGGGSAPKADEVKIEVCGLPNTPACKIDESGTPSPQDGKAAMTGAEITAAREAAESTLETVTGPKEFGFSFPSLFPEPSCSPLTWFKWKSYEGSVDLCEKLGFLRTLLMWLWPVLAAKYVWGRTVSANVGA